MRPIAKLLPILSVVFALMLSVNLHTIGAEDSPVKNVNLIRKVEPIVAGNVKKVTDSQADKGAVYQLLPTGRVAYSISDFSGEELNQFRVKGSVSVKGDGIAKITLNVSDQKAQSVTVTLTPVWLSHSLIWPPAGGDESAVPAGSKETINLAVEVIGNNICSAADFSLRVEDRAGSSGEAENVDEKLKNVPVPAGLVNVASLARIKATPPGFLLYRIRDGNDGTGIMADSIGESRAGTFEFMFDEPQKIAFIRFYEAPPRYAIFADADGDGQYERILADVNGHKNSWFDTDWLSHSFDPPITARAIELAFLTGNESLMEIEIYVPEAEAPDLRRSPQLKADMPELEKGSPVSMPKPQEGEQYVKGIVVEPWMYDWYGWHKAGRQALSDWPHFQRMAGDIEDWGANVIDLFPPATFVGPDEISPDRTARLWPSEYCKYSIQENDLAELCTAFHDRGMKVWVVQGQSYWCGWKEDERINSADFHQRQDWALERWAGENMEMIQSGVDGVSLCFDEAPHHCWDWKGWGDHYTKPELFDVEEFKKLYGYDSVPDAGDTEAYRKWKLFVYEGSGRYMRDSLARMRESGKPFDAFTRISVVDGWPNRLQFGTCYDIIGSVISDLDYFGTDPYHTREDPGLAHYRAAAYTKRLIAASKKGKAYVLFNPPWTERPEWFTRYPPVSVYGPALSSAMHGGGDCGYYRYNYFKERQDYYLHIKTAFGMLDTLAAWGGKKATVPRKIALLKSRASEDWWYLKGLYGPPGDQIDRARGNFADKAVLETLFTNGYPFVMYYLDQVDGLEELADFKLILIPFAYSVPREALPHLEKAAESGAKILVFEKEGEVDEFGTPYPQPVLRSLAAMGAVELLGEDLSDHGSDPGFQRQMCIRFDQILGEDKPLYLNRYGYDIEAGCLEKADDEKILFATNWTREHVTVDIGVNMPKGKYEMLRRDRAEITKVNLAGKEELSSKDLRKLRISLEPEEANIFLIRRKQDE